MPVYLLENDYHQRPSFHKFRDLAQAEQWLIKRFAGETEVRGYDDVALKAGYFSDPVNGEISWVDPDGTIWEVIGEEPTLYIGDHTQDP